MPKEIRENAEKAPTLPAEADVFIRTLEALDRVSTDIATGQAQEGSNQPQTKNETEKVGSTTS